MQVTPYHAYHAYHALTGCDYTASFCRRGKVNPLLEKDTEAQHALGNVACSEDLSNEWMKTLERYFCAVYGKNKLNDTNDVRKSTKVWRRRKVKLC